MDGFRNRNVLDLGIDQPIFTVVAGIYDIDPLGIGIDVDDQWLFLQFQLEQRFLCVQGGKGNLFKVHHPMSIRAAKIRVILEARHFDYPVFIVPRRPGFSRLVPLDPAFMLAHLPVHLVQGL